MRMRLHRSTGLLALCLACVTLAPTGDAAAGSLSDGVRLLQADAPNGVIALRHAAGLPAAAAGSGGPRVAPLGVDVHFIFDAQVGLQGFQVEVAYPLAKGEFLGSADGVACTSNGDGFFIANDRDDGTLALIQANFVDLAFPVTITCRFVPAMGETLTPADLGITVVEVTAGGTAGDPADLLTTIAVGELPICSTGLVRLTSGAGGVLDPGWTGIGHGASLPRDAALDLPLDCTPGESVCDIDGARTQDARVGAPLALSVGGVSMCVFNSVRAPLSGTFDCEGGCADVTVPLRSDVHLVVDQAQPCPPCVGDPTPNDGIAGGICNGGATPGAPCDAAGINDLFQNAGGAPPEAGTSSWDCRPSFASIGTIDVDLSPLTTDGTSATASVDCLSDAFPPGVCHCPGQVQPNSCIPDGVCPPSGFCEQNPPDGTCSGQPYRSCILTNPPETDCEDISPGAGECVASVRRCFTPTIERTGACGLDDGVLASVFCIPATRAPAVNTVVGLPGPGALTVPVRAAAATVALPTVGPTPEPSPGPTDGPTPVPPGCAASPQAECRRILQPNKSVLVLEKGRTGVDELAWRWLGGEATTPDAFGFPPFFTSYALCAYAETPESSLILARQVNPEICGNDSCWHATAKGGWVYKNPRANADGLTRVELVPGPNGAARVVVKGRSALLDLPSLPLIPPLTVQLQSSEGQCWETRFEPQDVQRNDGKRFRATARP